MLRSILRMHQAFAQAAAEKEPPAVELEHHSCLR